MQKINENRTIGQAFSKDLKNFFQSRINHPSLLGKQESVQMLSCLYPRFARNYGTRFSVTQMWWEDGTAWQHLAGQLRRQLSLGMHITVLAIALPYGTDLTVAFPKHSAKWWMRWWFFPCQLITLWKVISYFYTHPSDVPGHGMTN